jgi:hypothetical protein
MTTTIVLGFVVLPAVLFAVIYPVAITRLSPSLAVPYAKADVGRRAIAAVIDGLVLMTIGMLSRSAGSVLPALAGAVYLLLRDAIGGRSLGKLLSGLVVINLATGRPCSIGGSVRRNLFLLIPGANLVAIFLEATTIVRDPQGQRLGDRLAHTQVVDGLGVRDLAAAFQAWLRHPISAIEGRHGARRPVGLRVELRAPTGGGASAGRGDGRMTGRQGS